MSDPGWANNWGLKDATGAMKKSADAAMAAHDALEMAAKHTGSFVGPEKTIPPYVLDDPIIFGPPMLEPVTLGFKAINEWRAEHGLGPIEGGEALIPLNEYAVASEWMTTGTTTGNLPQQTVTEIIARIMRMIGHVTMRISEGVLGGQVQIGPIIMQVKNMKIAVSNDTLFPGSTVSYGAMDQLNTEIEFDVDDPQMLAKVVCEAGLHDWRPKPDNPAIIRCMRCGLTINHAAAHHAPWCDDLGKAWPLPAPPQLPAPAPSDATERAIDPPEEP